MADPFEDAPPPARGGTCCGLADSITAAELRRRLVCTNSGVFLGILVQFSLLIVVLAVLSQECVCDATGVGAPAARSPRRTARRRDRAREERTVAAPRGVARPSRAPHALRDHAPCAPHSVSVFRPRANCNPPHDCARRVRSARGNIALATDLHGLARAVADERVTSYVVASFAQSHPNESFPALRALAAQREAEVDARLDALEDALEEHAEVGRRLDAQFAQSAGLSDLYPALYRTRGAMRETRASRATIQVRLRVGLAGPEAREDAHGKGSASRESGTEARFFPAARTSACVCARARARASARTTPACSSPPLHPPARLLRSPCTRARGSQNARRGLRNGTFSPVQFHELLSRLDSAVYLVLLHLHDDGQRFSIGASGVSTFAILHRATSRFKTAFALTAGACQEENPRRARARESESVCTRRPLPSCSPLTSTL